jgi:hypothetical protein
MRHDPHFWLFMAAIGCFVLAAFPTGWKVRCEWLGVAFLAAAYVV